MGKIIGINLMQNQIYIAAPEDERTFLAGVQGGDEELFAAAKRASQQAYGQAAQEAVAAIPARLTVTQRGSLSQKASRQGIKVLRFVSLTNAALLGDYARNGAEVRRIDPQLVLTAVLRGTYLELSLTEVGSGVAEVLAIVMEEQADDASIPKAFRQLLKDAGKNPEEVRRLVLAEDAIRNETLYTAALNSAISCACVHSYTAKDLAAGAAACAQRIKGSDESLLILDVLPRSVGFKLADGTVLPLLARNETFPAIRSVQVYPAREYAEGLEISLYEGEFRSPEKNKKLGTFHGAVTARSPKPFTVSLNMNTDGILSLTVKDAAGNSLKLSGGAEGTFPLPALSAPESDGPPKPKETPLSYEPPMAARTQPEKKPAGRAEDALAFLAVYDDLLLALDHPTRDPAYEKGIRQALKKMETIFREQGVEFYAAAGEQFDPHIHEAVMHMESSGYGSNVIVKVLTRGVKKNGKIIRYAAVQVAN